MCARKISSYISVAPITFNAETYDDDDFDTRNGLRIMGFAFSHDNEEASFCALIDGDGEVTDYLKLGHFMLRRNQGFSTDKETQLRMGDREKLKRYFENYNKTVCLTLFINHFQVYTTKKATCYCAWL